MNNGCPDHISDKRGLPWLPHPGDTKKTVVHPAEFGETATFRLSQCSSIMKIYSHPTTMLDREELGAFGNRRNHVFVTRPQVLMVRTEKC